MRTRKKNPKKTKKQTNRKKVLPGLEPGLQGSEPWVLTNYTIEPLTPFFGFENTVIPRNIFWCRLELKGHSLKDSKKKNRFTDHIEVL